MIAKPSLYASIRVLGRHNDPSWCQRRYIGALYLPSQCPGAGYRETGGAALSAKQQLWPERARVGKHCHYGSLPERVLRITTGLSLGTARIRASCNDKHGQISTSDRTGCDHVLHACAVSISSL